MSRSLRSLCCAVLGSVLLVTLSASAATRSARPARSITKGDGSAASTAPIALSDPDGQELTLEELRRAGFHLDEVTAGYLPGPALNRPLTHLFAGAASTSN